MIKIINISLRSTLFFLSVPVFSVFFTLVSILFVRFMPYKCRFRYLTTWSRTVIFLAKHICGIKYKVSGAENIPTSEPYVILAKHQSQWETFFLVNFFQPVTAICKKELLELPLGVGYGIKLLEPIGIDRSDPRGALKTIQKEGLYSLKEKKRPVLIFPEGTRTPIGSKGKYAKSGAQLAILSDAPVIFISHNAGLFWPDKGFLKYPGTIEIKISKPVTTRNSGVSAKELTNKAENWIETQLSEMANHQ